VLTSVDESRAFLAEYEDTRGVPFGDDERSACAGSIVYSKAYGARCGHAVGRDDAGENLASFAEAFL